MSEVIINEVGPRDGLQNIENILSVNDRFELIKS
jgi:isopropylmalate/homocitrate/citramalate synthase